MHDGGHSRDVITGHYQTRRARRTHATADGWDAKQKDKRERERETERQRDGEGGRARETRLDWTTNPFNDAIVAARTKRCDLAATRIIIIISCCPTMNGDQGRQPGDSPTKHWLAEAAATAAVVESSGAEPT